MTKYTFATLDQWTKKTERRIDAVLKDATQSVIAFGCGLLRHGDYSLRGVFQHSVNSLFGLFCPLVQSCKSIFCHHFSLAKKSISGAI